MNDKLFEKKQRKVKLLAAFALSGSPLSAFNYSEDTSGDLADLATAPSIFVLDTGRNTLSANVTDVDDDFFTLSVLPGHVLSTVTLLNYNHPLLGNDSFLGYQNGTTLDQDPASLARGEISFALIGGDERGADLRSLFSANPSPASTSFPLPAGDYAFWLNETDDLPASVSLDFQVDSIPEPRSSLLLITGLLIMTRRKRTSSSTTS